MANIHPDVPLGEKLGAVVMAGFAGQQVSNVDPVVSDICEFHLGGVVL